MLTEPGVIIIALGCAYAMGFALNQGSTCSVTAARELIEHRSPRMTIGFMVAVAAAGLVWLPLAWLGDGQVTLAGGVSIAWSLIAGATLLGIGALINDACLLGTVSRIGHGETRFLALPFGLGLGFLIADRLNPTVSTPPLDNVLNQSLPVALVVIAGFVIAIGVGCTLMIRGGDRGDLRRWPLWCAMLVLGVSGAVLFALAPGWTYADVVQRSLHLNVGAMMAGVAAVAAALAIVIGAVSAGIVGRTFHYRPPRMAGVMRSIVGGAAMAIGATLVPGGNDTVLLAELPALTLSGIVGFTVMSGTVLGLMMLRRRLKRPRPDLI